MIPLEIQKIRDPNGSVSFKAIISLRDAINFSAESQKLIHIQDEYAKLVVLCQKLLAEIRSGHKQMADSQLQWKLADMIYSFIKRIEKDGFALANVGEAFPRDVGISKSQLNYLLKFRTRYPSVNGVSPKINWSKYRELMDFPEEKSRKQCEMLIKTGKIKSDTEIREFKRRLKANRIS
jgi:hypothetical protein